MNWSRPVFRNISATNVMATTACVLREGGQGKDQRYNEKFGE
jgi:hypothetical protein